MKLPSFFDDVPKLRVRDPLAEVVGCAEGGVLEYSYADAVRLAGHSCPTVAAAYWLTWRALHALYPDTLPERGRIKVEFRDSARTGSTGVVASVVQLLTGAAGSSGFKGFGGRYSRAGLASFSPGLPLLLRFTRLDDGTAVDAAADLSLPLPDAGFEALLEACVNGSADTASMARLGQLWQRRVQELLLDHAYDASVFIIRPVGRRRAVSLQRLVVPLPESWAKEDAYQRSALPDGGARRRYERPLGESEDAERVLGDGD